MQLNYLGRALVATALIFVAPALAAETIQTVVLTPEGPVTPFPGTGTFYLEGKPEGSLRVRAAFVRVRQGALGSALDCGSVSRTLTTHKLDENGARVLFDLPAGHHVVADVWSPPSDPKVEQADKQRFTDLMDDDVMLSPLWKGDGKADTYKILVDDPGFLSPGSVHCFYLYREKEELDSLDDKILTALLAATADYVSCAATTDRATCEGNAKKKLFTGLQEIWAGTDPKVRDAALTKIQDGLWNAGATFASSPADIRSDLEAWAASIKPPSKPDDGSLADIRFLTPESLTVRLLARAGDLHAVTQPPVGGVGPVVFKYYTDKGLLVQRLGLAADQKFILVGTSDTEPPTGVTEKLKVDPASLRIPGSSVGVADLLHFTDGRVRWNGRFVPVAVAYPEVRAIMLKGPKLTAAEKTQLKDLRDWVLSLSELFRERGRGGIREDLEGWAESRIACSAVPSAVREKAQVKCADGNSDPAAVRFGFENLDTSPFEHVAVTIKSHLDAVEHWNNPTSIEVVNKNRVLLEAPQPARLRLAIENKSFITQYITPVVGPTWISLGDRTGQLFTVSFQVSPYPNPFEQPMWTNGSEDLSRFWAVEFGVGINSEFDPRARAKGLELLGGRPLLAGFALRPLPYASVSFGGAVVMAQRSGFAAERPELSVAPYLTLSLQVNAIEALRGAYSGPLTSVVSVIPR